jgi:Flp pilus assembly protein TadD
MLDCEFFGVDAGPHHLVSVMIHCANTALVLLLLRKLTGSFWPSCFAAALFSWHPFFVESVVWVAERENVLSTFFGLLALLFYAGYAQTRSKQGPQPRPGLPPGGYFWALLFTVLSLMAKPMLVTLPCVMLLLDYWPLQRFPDFRLRLPIFFRLVREKWPFFLLIVPVCVVTVLAEHHDRLITPLGQWPLSARLCNATRSYSLYLWKTIWPTKLCILYPLPPQDQLVPQAQAAGLVLGSICMLVWLARRTCPYLLVGWLWFLGTLVPVIGLVQLSAQAMNDHYAYFPLVGLFVAVAFGLRDLITRFKIAPILAAAAAGLVLAACFFATRHQLSFWRDDETLFTRAVRVTENNGPAHNNLGIALAKKRLVSEARAHFLEASRLAPLWADPHNNLGNLLSQADNPAEALVEYSRAVQLKPRDPRMLTNLGRTLAALGRSDEALLCLQQAAEITRLDPGFPRPRVQLARVLLRLGRDAAALDECREAVRFDPNDLEALTLTAHVLAAEENPALRNGSAAVALAQRASALSRNQPFVLDVLGMAYAETGDFSNAQATASTAIQLATKTGMTNIEPWGARLDLYKKGQPWRESFWSTNASSIKRATD